MQLRVRNSGWLNLGVIVAALLIGVTLLCLTLGWLWFSRTPPAAAGMGTAVLNVLPLPTETSTPPAPTPTPEAAPGGDGDIPPSPPPGEIAAGAFVQITGTGGDGLRMRSEAGLEGAVLFLALESEVFQVEDGPTQADGYTWWFLVAPYDETVRGWAVSNYLQVVQAP